MIPCRSEPLISIGITDCTGISISAPRHSEKSDREHRLFTPRSDDAEAVARGVEIGRGFHWRRNSDFILRGELEISPERRLINRLSLESYLLSVISSEMNPEAPLEFLKAHAVISRSWALGKILRAHQSGSQGKLFSENEITDWLDTSDHEGFDVCADDHCQRYQGFAAVNAAARYAVESTRGLVLAHGDELLDARFSKCCGGSTELFSSCWQATDPDPLPSVECPYCSYEAVDAHHGLAEKIFKDYDRETRDWYDWRRSVPKSLIARRLSELYGIEKGAVRGIEPLTRGASGRIVRLRIDMELGSVVIGKELAIRRVLSDSCLYSSRFEVTGSDADTIELKGCGWGHGAGLCQIGAAVMGAEGKSFSEILTHYYPYSTLIRAYE